MASDFISEEKFRSDLLQEFSHLQSCECDFITGPMRSGAIASVYISHLLHIPFIPFGSFPSKGSRILIVDTNTSTGKTLRRAKSKYKEYYPLTFSLYSNKKPLKFWFEDLL